MISVFFEPSSRDCLHSQHFSADAMVSSTRTHILFHFMRPPDHDLPVPKICESKFVLFVDNGSSARHNIIIQFTNNRTNESFNTSTKNLDSKNPIFDCQNFSEQRTTCTVS